MAIVKVMAGDPIVNRIQDNVRDTVNPLLVDNAAMKTRATSIETNVSSVSSRVADLEGKEILDYELLSGQVLASGDNTLAHTLGRAPVGWFVVMRTTGAVIYDKQATNTSADSTLVLNSSGSCTVSVYLF